jgi:hypothetical protein
LQSDGLGLDILADWVTQELPEQAIKMMTAQIRQKYPNNDLSFCVPADLHEKWNNSPLVNALKRHDVQQGAFIFNSYGSLNSVIRLQVRGQPALTIHPNAKWTVNAIAGGYSHDVMPSGQEKPEPKRNDYAILMQGLESCVKALDNEENDEDYNYRVHNGRKYLSTVAA